MKTYDIEIHREHGTIQQLKSLTEDELQGIENLLEDDEELHIVMIHEDEPKFDLSLGFPRRIENE